MAKLVDWQWLTGEIETAVDAYTAQLDGLTGTEKVPNLDWNVADLTAHLASLRSVYVDQNDKAEAYVRPPDLAQWSIDVRSHIPTDELAHVADHLQSEVAALLTDYDDPDTDRWLYGQRTTHRNIVGAILVELILHGQDLGAFTGTKPELTSAQAQAGIPNMFAIAPSFVDASKAAKVAGTYHIGIRGLGDWTYEIDNSGTLNVNEGRPDRADARISSDAAAFVRVSLGRMNQFLPGLTGKTVAYGRKPWKLLALGDIVVEGV